MARGFLSGVFLGSVVCVGAVGVLSVVTPLPTSPEVGDAVSLVAAPDRPTQSGSGETARNGDATLATAPTSPQAPAPDPDTLAALDADTMVTAAQPETGSVDSLLPPVDTAQDGGVDMEGDAPVLPNPLALAPMAPEAADELSISTEPAQPPQPETEGVAGAFDNPAQPQVAVDEEIALPTAEAPAPQVDQVIIAEVAPQAPAEPADDANVAPADAMVPAPKAEPESPAVADTAAPQVDAEVMSPDTGEITTEAQPEASETATIAPQQPATPPEGTETAALADAPRIGTPAVNLLDRDSGVSIRRPASETTLVNTTNETGTTAGATSPKVRPIEQFAQAVQLEESKPLMSIVLIDDGNSPTNGAAGIAALRSFPYPLSFAVDATLPDAPDRIARLRNEGFEVLAMVDLPEGAQATDVETTFAATFAQLPEIIGILEGPAASQQSSRDVSDQVAAFLSQSGHGWITQAKGLNTAATLARKEGVPAKSIFRDFDSKGQTAVVIRRFLDQAAFKAGQEGGVIMLGRLRPETISALLLWGLQDRAGQVALAPVSAVLLAD